MMEQRSPEWYVVRLGKVTASRIADLMARTKTQQGLQVIVNVMDKVYETGRKVAHSFKQQMPIIFDDLLPQWNYRAVPQTS